MERSHRETLRFLTNLVQEERLVNIRSKTHIIGIIQFILNDEHNNEIGISPFQFTFGLKRAKFFQIPQAMEDKVKSKQLLNELDEHLKLVRLVAEAVQLKEQQARLEKNYLNPNNQYQEGDYVLKRNDPTKFKKNKLDPNYTGPYRVISTYKADITVENIITGAIKVLHMDDLKAFFGSKEEAFEVALRDLNQFLIDKIIAYKGNPLKRHSTTFLVKFSDGEYIWLPYSKDISSTTQFEEFCKTKMELTPLLYTLKDWNKLKKEIDNKPITDIQPGIIFYLDLRIWGQQYLDNSGLSNDNYELIYVVLCQYIKWENQKKMKILVRCPIFKYYFTWSNSGIMLYGKNLELKENMILIDQKQLQKYPKLKG